MSLVKKASKTFLWTILGNLIGFGMQLYIAKILGATEYGKANVIFGITGMYVVFFNFGLPWLIVREISVSDTKKSDKILSEYIILYWILDILFFPLIYYITKYSLIKSNMFSSINIFYVIVLFLLMQISDIIFNYYVGKRKQNISSFIKSFLIKIIFMVSFFLIYIFIYDYKALVISQILSLIIPTIILIKKFSFPYKLNFFHIIKNSWQYYLLTVTYSLYTNISKVLQKIYSTNEMVGYLSLGIMLGTLGDILGSVLANIAIPEFASYSKNKDYEKIKILFQKISRYNTYIILPIVIFTLFNLKRLISFLGKDYEKGFLIISIIVISKFFDSFVGPNGTLLNMSGHQKFEIFNGLTMIFVGITTGIILGNKFEWGIAASIALSAIIVNVLKFIEVGIIFKIYPYTKYTLFYILINSFLYSLVFYLTKGLSSILFWIIINGIITIIAIIFFFVFSPIKEDKNFIISYIQKLLS
ncbi:hypothetical protein XO10_06150 [Marinitoga sp. 1135]|uniref:lipopolysaccharide biosynthesis protein n=1 Tax=Marinitoga sp. 1135 TaxID=1643333 RepID=UPI0015868F09|nr:hypothetical protein [Marinitoga sp. 1135]